MNSKLKKFSHIENKIQFIIISIAKLIKRESIPIQGVHALL